MKLLFTAGTLPMVANAPLFKTDRGPVRAVTVNGVHLVATQKDGMNVTVSVEGVASLQTAIQAAIKATERKLPILVSVEKVDSYAAAMRAAMGDDSADFDAVTACAVPDDSNAMCGQMIDDLVAALRISEGRYFCIVVEKASREGVRLPDMPRLLDKAYEQYDSDRETGSVGLAMDSTSGNDLFNIRVERSEAKTMRAALIKAMPGGGQPFKLKAKRLPSNTMALVKKHETGVSEWAIAVEDDGAIFVANVTTGITEPDRFAPRVEAALYALQEKRKREFDDAPFMEVGHGGDANMTVEDLFRKYTPGDVPQEVKSGNPPKWVGAIYTSQKLERRDLAEFSVQEKSTGKWFNVMIYGRKNFDAANGPALLYRGLKKFMPKGPEPGGKFKLFFEQWELATR